MPPQSWLYVAPQRVRKAPLDFPRCHTWEEHEALNLQRLARVFEFQGCIAFVGSGASACLGYPKWSALLPTLRELRSLLKNPLSARDTALYSELAVSVSHKDEAARIAPTRAIQIAEGIVGRTTIVDHLRNRFFVQETAAERELRLDRAKLRSGASPFPELLKMPIRRFVTTNYDNEIEAALASTLGHAAWNPAKSFEQNDPSRLAIFCVAMATENRNMVFHCHGTLEGEIERLAPPSSPGDQPSHRGKSRLVLTDADYNLWYLSREYAPYTFQRGLDIVLQSNPLFFVGYTLSDVDLLRILRRATLRSESDRVAPNSFLLLRHETGGSSPRPHVGVQENAWKQAKQIELGVNLLPFNPENGNTLQKELASITKKCSGLREHWRIQPRVKTISRGPTGSILPRPGSTGAYADPWFATPANPAESSAGRIEQAFNNSRLVALIGPPGAGKFLRVSQYVHKLSAENSLALVFHSYNNDDVYSALKRIQAALATKRPRPACLVINNLDLLLGMEPCQEWKPRNQASRDFLTKMEQWSTDRTLGGLRVLLTARYLPPDDQLFPAADPHLPTTQPGFTPSVHRLIAGSSSFLLPSRSMYRGIQRFLLADELRLTQHEIGLIEPQPPFIPPAAPPQPPAGAAPSVTSALPAPQFDSMAIFDQLAWELQGEQNGMILAASFIQSFDKPSNSPEERTGRCIGLLEALRSNSSERGTRVVRHILRELDAPSNALPRAAATPPRRFETLLAFLSCFNTPFARLIIDETSQLCQAHLAGTAFTGSLTASAQTLDKAVLETLLNLGLLQAIGDLEPSDTEDPVRLPIEPERNYIVPPLVRHYFREVLHHSSQISIREFGLHGLLSRGPFNSPGIAMTPGRPRKPTLLFQWFIRRAIMETSFDAESAVGRAGISPYRARILLRAAIDILRSNFACNSVPAWGQFRDYIDMLSITIDLLRNIAIDTGDTWQPGEDTWQPGAQPHCVSNDAVASAEEMLYLYNELGLAFYHTGSVQDALRVWGLASDWQKAVALDDPKQGEMYAASLNSHLGTAYMQLGRMQTAHDCFSKALNQSRNTDELDLALRMEGMIARVDHFRGSVRDARATYNRIIERLGELGNRRAQSYFMRHLSALEIRFGKFEDGKRLAEESLAIAAGENAADLVAFASELTGRVLKTAGRDAEALREYDIALAQAKKLDIARLQIDIILGKAEIQLRLGDPHSARATAIEALKLSNENLLVLRQSKALLLLGRTAARLGDLGLGKNILQHARRLAAESQFRLVEHDADIALASLRTGGSEASDSATHKSDVNPPPA